MDRIQKQKETGFSFQPILLVWFIDVCVIINCNQVRHYGMQMVETLSIMKIFWYSTDEVAIPFIRIA